MSRVRLVPIFLVAIVVLCVLFGGWQAYQHFNLLNPLKKNLQQVSGVQTVAILTGSPDVVQVHLGPFSKLENGDLQQTYQDIASQIETRLGSGVSVQLTDHHDALLTDTFESFQPYLRQGLAKQNYLQMISQLSQMAQRKHVNARITMDGQNVYIQLAKGSHYLYQVIPYGTHQGGAAS